MLIPDTFSQSGATAHAAKIVRYWLARGGIVKTRLEPLKAKYESETGRSGTINGYVVRSDMVNGWPSQWENGRRPRLHLS